MLQHIGVMEADTNSNSAILQPGRAWNVGQLIMTRDDKVWKQSETPAVRNSQVKRTSTSGISVNACEIGTTMRGCAGQHMPGATPHFIAIESEDGSLTMAIRWPLPALFVEAALVCPPKNISSKEVTWKTMESR